MPAHRIYHEANGYLTGLIPNEEWRVRKRQNYYFNAIRDVDQQIVQVLDQLDRLGLTDKTIVIFTSDHGELLGSHGGLSGKGTTAYASRTTCRCWSSIPRSRAASAASRRPRISTSCRPSSP